MPGFEKTLFDGELVTKDKENKSIYLFAVFDIYYFKGESLKDRILARTSAQKEEGDVKKSRMEYLIDIFDKLE